MKLSLEGKRITIQNIEKNTLNSLNQEHVAFWLVLKALFRGVTSWSNIKKMTKISTATLSRKMKKMQGMKIIKRKIVPGFPPRTAYRVNKEHPNYAKIKWLEAETELLTITDEIIKGTIEVSKLETAEQTLHKLMDDFENQTSKTLMDLLKIPLSKDPEEWRPLITTLTTIRVMQRFWTMYEALLSEGKRQQAIRILEQRVKQYEPIKSLQ